MIFDPILLALLALLALHILVEDMRTTWVPLESLLAFLALSVIAAVVLPKTGQTLADNLGGGLIGLAMGVAARGYTRLRMGVSAFGVADIILMTSAGLLVGVSLFGPWLLSACLLALLGHWLLSRRAGLRDTQVDGVDVSALPFCPALIVSIVIFEALLRLGVINTLPIL